MFRAIAPEVGLPPTARCWQGSPTTRLCPSRSVLRCPNELGHVHHTQEMHRTAVFVLLEKLVLGGGWCVVGTQAVLPRTGRGPQLPASLWAFMPPRGYSCLSLMCRHEMTFVKPPPGQWLAFNGCSVSGRGPSLSPSSTGSVCFPSTSGVPGAAEVQRG